jgi:hypothetical protein
MYVMEKKGEKETISDNDRGKWGKAEVHARAKLLS